MSIQDALLIVFGIGLCFMGYSMFQGMLPLWGFVLGGWIAYTLLPSILGAAQASELLFQIIGIAVGGLIGAAIAVPLYFVIVFLSGASLGMMFGVMLGVLADIGGISSIRQLTTFTSMSFPPVPQSTTQFILMIIGGLILGVAAIQFQKFMICASSSFLGAAAVVTGLGGPIVNVATSEASRGAVIIITWMLLGLIGLFVQFRMMGEV